MIWYHNIIAEEPQTKMYESFYKVISELCYLLNKKYEHSLLMQIGNSHYSIGLSLFSPKTTLKYVRIKLKFLLAYIYYDKNI